MPITPHAIWNFVEQSDFCWVMLFYTTENKTMIEFNQHERLKITFRKVQPFPLQVILAKIDQNLAIEPSIHSSKKLFR